MTKKYKWSEFPSRIKRRQWMKTPEGRRINNANTKAYNRKHPEHVKFGNLKRRSAEEGMPFVLTRQEFAKWFLSKEQICEYCGVVDLSLAGIPSNGVPMICFSIDRKNPHLPYTIENMAFCCWFCNRLKSDFFSHDEWKEIAIKYVRPKWMAKAQAAMDKAA